MVVMIRQGRRVCNATCYNARNPKCRCICGGKHHGKREEGAVKMNRELFGMKENRSKYVIVEDDFLQEEPLVIKDIGHDAKSVTNDAENVVADLVKTGKLPAGRRLFYYDSENRLDEIVVEDGRFAGFRPGLR